MHFKSLNEDVGFFSEANIFEEEREEVDLKEIHICPEKKLIF